MAMNGLQHNLECLSKDNLKYMKENYFHPNRTWCWATPNDISKSIKVTSLEEYKQVHLKAAIKKI